MTNENETALARETEQITAADIACECGAFAADNAAEDCMRDMLTAEAMWESWHSKENIEPVPAMPDDFPLMYRRQALRQGGRGTLAVIAAAESAAYRRTEPKGWKPGRTADLESHYQDWLSRHGLRPASADEILASGAVTPGEAAWLSAFIVLWNEAEAGL